ncbi:MAG: trigger factor, partial [Myxococcota bacterium]
VSVEETGPVERRLRIEIPTTEVDAAFESFFREMRRSAHIRGFRPGKAPREVLEQYYGDRASGEVLQRLVESSLFKAIEEKQLEVLGEPRLEPSDMPKPGAQYTYDAHVDVRPEINVTAVKGLELKRPVLPIPEKDPIEAHIEDLRQRHAQVIEEDSAVPAAAGLIAVIDYVGKIDGEPFEGSSARESQIELGAGRTFGGFEDHLIGLRVGEDTAFEVAMPEDHADEKLRAKTVHFEVKLVALKRRELPTLDDEFAKDVSNFATLAELRADLERRIGEGRAAELKRLERAAVVEKLVESNPFPVPPALVESQLRARIQRMLQQFGGAQLDSELLGPQVERWQAEMRPQVEREIKLALLAPEIAKLESISASDEEIDAQLTRIAESSQRKFSEVKREYREHGMLDSLRAGLVEEKVVEFALAEAKL